jgi:hypothetical protein
MKKNFLTKEGYEELIQELNELKTVKLPLVLERLGEAKAMGDLSENFEYKSALEDKDFINSRMSEIATLVQDVEIIKEEGKSAKGERTVDYGAKDIFAKFQNIKFFTQLKSSRWMRRHDYFCKFIPDSFFRNFFQKF